MERHNDDDGQDDGGNMSDAEATRFRAMVVRCNFLGSDRPDVQIAATGASRSMAAPHKGDREKVVRISKPVNREYRRIVHVFLVIHVFSDSDSDLSSAHLRSGGRGIHGIGAGVPPSVHKATTHHSPEPVSTRRLHYHICHEE